MARLLTLIRDFSKKIKWDLQENIKNIITD